MVGGAFRKDRELSAAEEKFSLSVAGRVSSLLKGEAPVAFVLVVGGFFSVPLGAKRERPEIYRLRFLTFFEAAMVGEPQCPVYCGSP